MSAEGTTERVLRLLALLQQRSLWTAIELSSELDVSDRSVRRDVERLRSLGYPVHAETRCAFVSCTPESGRRLGSATRNPFGWSPPVGTGT